MEIKAMLKYYYRLEKSQSTFPLLYDAFIESKGLSDVNKLSWFSSIDVIVILYLPLSIGSA
jgi:hypothetical protein